VCVCVCVLSLTRLHVVPVFGEAGRGLSVVSLAGPSLLTPTIDGGLDIHVSTTIMAKKIDLNAVATRLGLHVSRI
jgi:hypothetical protein